MKEIRIDNGQVTFNKNGFYVTLPALDVLVKAASALGLYSGYEDKRDYRVMHANGKLVLQEDISCHGSPCWKDVKVLEDDPEKVKAYLAFREVLKAARRADRE